MAEEITSLLVLFQASIILASGIILDTISKKTRVPFIVMLVLTGTLLSSIGFVNIKSLGVIPDLVRTVALVLIVFASGFYLRLDTLMKESNIILSLSTIGVIFNVVLIASAAHFFLGLPVLIAAFLGTLLGGTDIAAVSNALSSSGSKLQEIIAGEAIFNTPLSVILPLVILDFLTKPENSLIAIPIYSAKLTGLVFLGLVFGVAGFFFGRKLLDYFSHDYEEIAGILLALGVYTLTELFFGSGILAVAVTSILLNSSSIPGKKSFTDFQKQISFMLTVFVFVLLGTEFTFEGLIKLSITRFEVIVVIIALIISRLLTALVLGYKSGLNIKEKLLLGFIAPRGLAPAALAPLLFSVPGISVEVAASVVKIVYIAIIVSIFISIIVLKSVREEFSGIKLESLLEYRAGKRI